MPKPAYIGSRGAARLPAESAANEGLVDVALQAVMGDGAPMGAVFLGEQFGIGRDDLEDLGFIVGS